MSRAVGGYVRRSERRYVPPAPGNEMRGPDWMRYSVLPSGAVMCWRAEPPAFQSTPGPQPFLPIQEEPARTPSLDLERAFAGIYGNLTAAGRVMATILGAPEQPGPPYVHTFVPPEPVGQDEDGNDIYPPPGPAWTLTEGR